MLTDTEKAVATGIEVKPREIAIALSDDATVPLFLTLPPIDDLRSIQKLRDGHASFVEVSAGASDRFREHFALQHQLLLRKQERFSESETYLNHLANLAELSGDLDSGERYLRSAVSLSADRFITHRLEANLLRQSKLVALEANSADEIAQNDYDTLLHITYSAVLRGDYNRALASIDRALNIDPIDYRGRMLVGALYLYSGEYQRAIQNFKIAAEDRGNSSALFFNLAIAHYCLGDIAKAKTAVIKAVSINPLGEEAIAFYADLTFKEHKASEAIACLEKFIRYEQKQSPMWSRLARAYYFSDRLEDALDALRNEAAAKESSGVWNNIGVVYSRMGNTQRALQYYQHAIQGDAVKHEEGAQLALGNLLSLLNIQGMHQEALAIATPIVESDQLTEFLKKKAISRFCTAYLAALVESGNRDQASRLVDHWLRFPETSQQLQLGLISYQLSRHSLIEPDQYKALRYAHLALHGLDACTTCAPELRPALVNNVVFAYLEFGRVEDAVKLLPELAKEVHKNPFSTATLGLYHLMKGSIQRGEELYREAISLSADQGARESIRQKMNLEIGKAYLSRGDNRTARKYLEKAAHKKKSMVPILQEQAMSVLTTIGRPH
jgi:tetratricopeptide (TPR) repeat protein